MNELLAGLPQVSAAQVVVETTEGGRAELVAYVVAAPSTTPEQLHTAVLSRLDGHLTMAPHRYVLGRTLPEV